MHRALPTCIAVLTIAAAMAAGCASARAQEPAPAAVAVQGSEEARQQLASKHAPIVYMKEQQDACGSTSHRDPRGEVFFPISVESVLGHDEITLHDSSGAAVTSAPDAADLFDKGEGWYINLPGNPNRPECSYENTFLAITPAPDPVVYAHYTQEPGRPDELVLQYWLYFYFNDWNNNHESDWEFLQLVFDASTVEEALERAPSRVIYSQHGGGEQADWRDGKVQKEGDRPVVYVADGSHALQFDDKTYLGKGESGTGFGCDDASGPSVRVDPEARVIPDNVTSADDPYAWIGFTGRWGEQRSGEFNGPTGPNTKTPWTEPLGWMERQRDSSVEVPKDSIGPNAAYAFCGVVAFGSQLLFAGGIWVTLAFVLGAVLTVGVTARNTRFRPVVTAPIAQSRRFGQIIRSALTIERRHAGLFLGIGALFIPLGFIAAGLQGFILENPPLEPLLDTIDESSVEAVVALGLGTLELGIAYWLVISACIVAIGALQRGEEIGVVECYRRVWRSIRALVAARLAALGIIVLLSVTVVGIPLAIYLGVRWLFIEHAILLDGAGRVEARERSAALVRGYWWPTFGASTAVVLLAVTAGPILGVLLVLLTSRSLVAINMVSSILYLALVPFAGIALTLLYYDRKLAQEEAAGDAESAETATVAHG